MKHEFPYWRLYDKDGLLLDEVRAWNLKGARWLFKYRGRTGGRVKKIYKRARRTNEPSIHKRRRR